MTKSKSVVFSILDSLPVRTQIGFGIHENCKLTNVSIEPKKKDGQLIERNTYVTFTKYDSEGEAIAQTEFSYWNLKHDNEYSLQNLARQVSNLIEIVNVVTDGKVSYDPFTEGGFDDYEEVQNQLSTKKGVKKVQDLIETSFAEAIEGYVGRSCPTLRLKVVTTYDGQYTELPGEGHFLENSDEVTLEDTQLSMSAKELRARDKGLVPKKETADNSTSKPTSKSKKTMMDL